jgi:hypothetical protein
MTTGIQKEYLSVTETAKIVRKSLKTQFPGVKFSVISNSYAGGASIDVRWTDGPLDKDVNEEVSQYAGGGFDGSIDMAYHKSHYLNPDGETMVLVNQGTARSLGTVEAEDNSGFAGLMPEGTRQVQFGADYVFTRREISDQDRKREECIEWMYSHLHMDGETTGDPNIDRFGYTWLSLIADGMVRNWVDGQDLQEAFDTHRV